MQVILNGEPHTLMTELMVTDLLDELKLKGKLAIEINQQIIPKSEYHRTQLQEGDKIEIVNAIGGG